MKKLLTLALSLLMIMSVCLTGAIAEEGSVVIENNGRTTTYNSVAGRNPSVPKKGERTP